MALSPAGSYTEPGAPGQRRRGWAALALLLGVSTVLPWPGTSTASAQGSAARGGSAAARRPATAPTLSLDAARKATVAASAALPAPARGKLLPGFKHVPQRWNNCGPASAVIALSGFGVLRDQLAAQAQLKPDREDNNVSPAELAHYIRGQGLEARVLVNGNRDIAKRLIDAGLPVLAEQWIDVQSHGQMGHYRVVIGYDEARGEFIAHDTYYGPKLRLAYDRFDAMWRPFLGTYVVVYRPEQEQAARDAVGADWEEGAMWSRALVEREAALAAGGGDAWAWFALGTARNHAGNHAGAVEAFDRAVAIGLPPRTFWYQFEYLESMDALGQNEKVIALADRMLAMMKGENMEESRYWRARALERLGRSEEARADLERALEFNPLFAPARQALGR